MRSFALTGRNSPESKQGEFFSQPLENLEFEEAGIMHGILCLQHVLYHFERSSVSCTYLEEPAFYKEASDNSLSWKACVIFSFYICLAETLGAAANLPA